MSDAELIDWKDLTGNKFNRALHPSMLNDGGYTCESVIRRAGESRKTMFKVVYNREYLIEYLGRTICKHLFTVGKKGTLKLLDEAWDTYYPNSVKPTARSTAKK